MSENEKYNYGIYRGISYDYDYKNKERNIRNNISYMLNRSLQMFDYTGLPDTIPKRELERMLQTQGYICVTEINGELFALSGHLSGEPNEYLIPEKIQINNIKLKLNKELVIGSECVLIMNDDLGIGLIPIFSKFSTILCENEITMLLASINKRSNSIMTASDENTAESSRAYLKKLHDGELGVVMDNKLYDSFKNNPNGENNTSLSDLIDYHQYMKATMYNEIGLKDNINMKKERLITGELSENTDGLYPLVDSMLSSREIAIKEINKMYDTNITVELNSSWAERNVKKELLNVEPKDDVEVDSGDDSNDDSSDGSDDKVDDNNV